MSVLSYIELCDLIDKGVIVGSEPDYASVNSASIDIHLGDMLLIENREVGHMDSIKFLNKKSQLSMNLRDLGSERPTYTMAPGEFLLASSREIFNLPSNISAEYKLKSSMARLGLDHLNAGWCDAGWNGSVLTLELKNQTNHHRIVLTKGDKIGQMVFYRCAPVPTDQSYSEKGRYNNTMMTTESKGV